MEQGVDGSVPVDVETIQGGTMRSSVIRAGGKVIRAPQAASSRTHLRKHRTLYLFSVDGNLSGIGN